MEQAKERGLNMGDKDLHVLQCTINNYVSAILTDMDSMDIDVDNVSIDINISIKENTTDDVANIVVSV